MKGVVIVDKPAGITSHDAVDRVRKLLGERKAGHTGTLDPMATGVLAVCVGEATKIASFLTGDDKVYEATMRLGVRTDTLDMTGQVLTEQEPRATDADVKAVLAAFAGTITQVPPQYSAVKVRGKALYKWARKGIRVEPPAREVEIREILLQGIELPRVRFTVTCSKGTYIRTLCADMGDRLGCGAALEQLRRTRSGIFRLQDAVRLDGDERRRDPGEARAGPDPHEPGPSGPAGHRDPAAFGAEAGEGPSARCARALQPCKFLLLRRQMW